MNLPAKHAWRVPAHAEPLVGRQRELDKLDRALELAAGGNGGLWLMLGQPGIGKSRLVEDLAGKSPIRVFWGRSWEAGGAPPFWPWCQVMRAMLRQGWKPSQAEVLAPLLPELTPEQRPSLPPEDARFQLLDAAVHSLCEAAATEPTLLILEDMHAADRPSLLLAELLADAARSTSLMVLFSAREGELRKHHPELLSSLERKSSVMRLGALSDHEIQAYVHAALAPDVPSPKVVEDLCRTTEGHPLFLVEAVRLHQAHGTSANQIPPNVHAVLAGRLQALGEQAGHTLQVASVLGRDIERDRLAQLIDEADVSAHLEAAEAASLLLRIGPSAYRFSHILMREVAYRALPAELRRSLHRRAAEALRASTPAPWNEIVHHLRRAGSPELPMAAERAAEEATTRLAFEDAVLLLDEAVRADRSAGKLDGDRLLALAQAQLTAGELVRGRETCMEVASLSRSQGNAELLCRAALAYGSVFVIAEVDNRLASLLEEALDALGDQDHPLRARALARLAAALQPASNPEHPIAMARQAVDVARRIGDRETLLRTIRSASSAMMDLADPVERLVLNREHVLLASQLGDRVEQWRGHTRSAFNAAELIDVQHRDESVARAGALADELRLPHYQWSAIGLQAMLADHRGQFEVAEGLSQKATQLGAGDPNAERAMALQRVIRLRSQGKWSELLTQLAQLRALTRSMRFAMEMADFFEADVRARQGRAFDLDPEAVEVFLALGDRSFLTLAGEVVARAGDRDLAVRVEARLAPYADHITSFGAFAHALGPPVARTLGLLARCLGRSDDARSYFELAWTKAEQSGAPAECAWIAYELGLLGDARYTEKARRLASELQLEGLSTLLGAVAVQVRSTKLAMEPQGETWLLHFEGRTTTLKNTKGARILHQLVADPHREHHVLDLVEGGAPTLIEQDAGELIDAQARAAYIERAKHLKQELATAEAHADLGSIEKHRAELEQLEEALSAAMGLGGRARRSGASSEKARVNVQRRLRDVIKRIAKHDAAAAKHLDRSVRTGTHCVYEP